MKRVTFLWTDTTPVNGPVKGPYTFARLRELWEAGEITGESKLFVTERDEETYKVRCFNLKAENIRQNLETGVEINLDILIAESSGES